MKKEYFNQAKKRAKKNQTDIANVFGCNQAAISQKISRETFTDEELAQIAQLFGCKYKCYFEFPDGQRFGIY